MSVYAGLEPSALVNIDPMVQPLKEACWNLTF